MANVGSAEPLSLDQMIQNLLASQQDKSGVPGGHLTLDQILARGTGGGTDQLAALKTLLGGAGGGGGQGSQSGGTGSNALVGNPVYGLNQLGAAALNQPMTVTPFGTATIDPKSGVAQTAPQPITSKGVPKAPTGPWSNVPGVMGGAAGQGQYAQGVFSQPAPSTTTITPTTPATYAPTSTGAGTPFATPPPAPGASVPSQQPQPFAMPPGGPMFGGPQVNYVPGAFQTPPFGTAPEAPGAASPATAHQALAPFLSAHASGLADAGKALYAHFGGDPNSATQKDIASFHSELQGALAGGPPIKKRSGGLVPGRGNEDTVPALLTPGEYVIPKSQVAEIFGGKTPTASQVAEVFGARAYASGGPVTDDDNQPPEARRKTLATSQSKTAPTISPTSSPDQPSQPSSTPPPAPGSTTDLAKLFAAKRGLTSAEQIAQAGGSSPGLGAAAQQAWARGINPNVGLPVGASGYVNAAGQQIAPTPGTAGYQGAMPQVASAISGLASGLSQAAQAYASSFKPWQMQKSAIPTPPPAEPAAQLTQAQVPQPNRQQQTISPFNPYYPYT
jgi:hypothetical protein